MHNQTFSPDGTVCSLKQDGEGQLDLNIDGVSHHSWFRRKKKMSLWKHWDYQKAEDKIEG